MNNIYVATESMGILILLILLYANVFENKKVSKKRSIYSMLLLLNLMIVIADLLAWNKNTFHLPDRIYVILIAITYVVPFCAQAVFSLYVHAHLSAKTRVSKLPFLIMHYFSVCAGIISLVFCITGKMFEIRDGVWHSGAMDPLYYLFYVGSLLCFSVVIAISGRKIGIHDLLAVLSFCIVPLISILISLSGANINLSIPFLAINMLLIYIMLQADNETELLSQSNTDALTGLFNRKFYEDCLLQYPAVPPEKDFVYASIDINGLKVVNDSLGHAAGDELIMGTARCLKQTIGNYGRIFRTGGDEFAAIFFANAQSLEDILKDLQLTTDTWTGTLCNELHLSVGVVAKREFPTETVRGIANIADVRMYKSKAAYYARKGVDRRGQMAAHTALCNLYTKILKINITTDSYAIINMDPDEKKDSMGFSDKISTWLKDFAASGQVHEDDLAEYLTKTNMVYLQNYFKADKTSISIHYRRNFAGEFKQAVMEIIPANDYTEDNQSLFLYVKMVDR